MTWTTVDPFVAGEVLAAARIEAMRTNDLHMKAILDALPFATAAGAGSQVFTGTTAVGSFSLPAGRFSQPPIVVMLTRTTSYGVTWSAVATTPTSVSYQGFNGANGLTVPFQWFALQMTSSSAAG